MGISSFAIAYGLTRVGYIAVIDLGHEISIWIVFLALLMMTSTNVQGPCQLLRSFLRSPVIIGITAGLFFNVTGLEILSPDSQYAALYWRLMMF